MDERNIFDELMQGMQELEDNQQGKNTLKSCKLTERPPATPVPDELRNLCED